MIHALPKKLEGKERLLSEVISLVTPVHVSSLRRNSYKRGKWLFKLLNIPNIDGISGKQTEQIVHWFETRWLEKNLVEIVFWFKTYFESSWARQYKPGVNLQRQKLDKLEGGTGHELHCEVLCYSVPEEPKPGEGGCHCR